MLILSFSLGNCFLKSQSTSLRGIFSLLGIMNKCPKDRTVWMVDAPKQTLHCALQGLLYFIEMDVAEYAWSGAGKGVPTGQSDIQILMFSCLFHLPQSDFQAYSKSQV